MASKRLCRRSWWLCTLPAGHSGACRPLLKEVARHNKRRRPSDSERLTWLLENEFVVCYYTDGKKEPMVRARKDIDRLMREEAKK